MRLWNIQHKTQESVFPGHISGITSLSITSDNKYIMSGSWDFSVRIWRLQDRTQETVLQGHTGCVSSITITSDLKYIVSGSSDNTARIWHHPK